jgi:hypothetical protein
MNLKKYLFYLRMHMQLSIRSELTLKYSTVVCLQLCKRMSCTRVVTSMQEKVIGQLKSREELNRWFGEGTRKQTKAFNGNGRFCGRQTIDSIRYNNTSRL